MYLNSVYVNSDFFLPYLYGCILYMLTKLPTYYSAEKACCTLDRDVFPDKFFANPSSPQAITTALNESRLFLFHFISFFPLLTTAN